jgi:hypothetical protein
MRRAVDPQIKGMHMTNAIQILEQMGSNPSRSAPDYAATVSALDLDAMQKRALLQNDPTALNRLLAGRPQVFCAIFAEEGDE